MAEYEDLRQRHPAFLTTLMPEHVQRLRWPADRLHQERRDRLRDLLRVAKASSPWHRDRLAGVEPDGFEEADLAGLPPMTKDDLMANWDRVVTDPRLTRELVEGHLAGLESNAYLADELHAVASGGSTGRRGIFVFGWREWAVAYAGFMRPALWDRAVTPELAALPMRVAMIGARNATHMTSALPQTFANPMVDLARFPVTQPIDQIVAGLNAYQPLALMSYPSMLALLAVEARAGQLRILPRRITSTSEPLLPEVRRALTQAFCAPVANMYGTSEAGPIGVGCYRGPGIHLRDDLVIVEPVDLAGRPVPPGVRSDKVYLTSSSP
jgi:phenylacetate-CoA ligase